MQVVRINQREMTDCAICVAAMVLSYSYERVLEDRRRRYPQLDNKTAWWEWYFQDEGRVVDYLPLAQLQVVQVKDSAVIGVLMANNPAIEKGHVVVVDEVGVVDPADGCPDHLMFARWASLKVTQGFVLDRDFLAVARRVSAPSFRLGS
jgi:hypothetical protein